MKIYKIGDKALISLNGDCYKLIIRDWNQFLNRENLRSKILEELKNAERLEENSIPSIHQFDAPIGDQEIWAAGVTYHRSKVEREKESQEGGGAQFYDKVYDAERPELFFKSTPSRTVGSGHEIFIRKDSTWNVPEPELTLFVSSKGGIEGYTIGNDMSSRSIEGENPLYLPQAKTYEKCAALGPCIYLPESGIVNDTQIKLEIRREGNQIFEGSTSINKMKRRFEDLVEYLFRECKFPVGCFLMTGTGIVPDEHFTLLIRDEVRITIDGIGELVNRVGQNN